MSKIRTYLLAVITLFIATNIVFANKIQATVDKPAYKENTIIAYFDEKGHLLDRKEGSTYYRKVIADKGNNSYIIQDFYTKTDQKQIDPVLFANIKNMNSFISEEIGDIDGRYIQWYENGRKEFEAFYKNNIPVEGEKSWYPNGQLKSDIKLKDGKILSPQKTWYENGKQQYYFEIINAKENKAKLIEWYENGQKKLEQTSNGPTYSSKEWYETGKEKREGSYNKNKEEIGVHKEWYANGQLQSECEYKDNQPSSCKLWNEQGQLVSE